MAHDKDGNLLPLMLSDLVKIAQEILTEHGDMPVSVITCVPGYEYNEEHNLPVSDKPSMTKPKWIKSYWPGQFVGAFTIEGV